MRDKPRLQTFLNLLACSPFSGERLAMSEFGMGEPGLQRLDVGLRLMQRPTCRAVGTALGFEGSFQLRDPRLEHRGWVVIAAAVQHYDWHAAVLHEPMTWAGLVGALLRRCAGRAL